MSTTTRDESNWLVKSGDRVLGPFSRDQIKTMLYDKELVVIDEITTPMGRWRYIRDEPIFAVVVEEVRKSHLSTREDTELGTHEGTAITATGGGTPTDYIQSTANTRDVNSSSPPPLSGGPEQPVQSRIQTPQATKTYGSNSDRRVQESAGHTTRLIWIAAIVILIGAGFLLFRMQNPVSVAPVVMTSDLPDRAKTAQALGDYRSAIAAYTQLEEAGQATAEMKIDHAVLRARLRDEANPPDRILDSVPKTLSPAQTARFETARGLAALNESRSAEQIRKAAAHFAAAQKADRSFAPAAFNAAMTSFLVAEGSAAEGPERARISNEFIRIAEMPTLDVSGRIVAKIMSAYVRIRSNEPAMFINAGDDLAALQKNIVQYWQEASLLSAYAKVKLGQSAQAARDFRLMLGADPFVTDEHLTDPYLYTAPLSWSGLKPVCEELHQKTMEAGTQANRRQDSTIESMLYFCQYKSGERPDDVRAQMKELEAKSVSDPLVRSISAYMLMKISPDQAKAKLADASDSVSWELGRIIRGRLCGADSLECLNAAFRSTAVLRTAIYFKVASARYSLRQAGLLKEQGDEPEAKAQEAVAREMLGNVRSVSPNYIPLLTVEAERGAE